ncbi:undecaprenyl-phosphate 4-deoxy-4-formamido-L-arabinose transferase [Lachnospiraceae bacterium]|nr:undecaprenyl-phosphate 4-deoxy-4-formamido-L-arabinose transferase [Lachnospiraceae bacterium]
MEKMKYSIVIPCYKSSKTISKVVELTMGEMQGKEAEFILVNDASPDGGATFRVLSELAETYGNVTVIDLAKNAGQHNAVMAGLNYARGDYIIAMDDDMQTHPSQIHKLLEEMEQGWDIVYAYYPRKKHSWYRNVGSAVNFWTVRKLIGKPRDLKTSSFWVIRKFVRDYVIQYQNPYAYLQGLFLRTTQKITCVPVEHFERAEGTSNYNLKALIRLWSNVLGFSVVPLRMAIWLGLCFSLIGIVFMIFYLLSLK